MQIHVDSAPLIAAVSLTDEGPAAKRRCIRTIRKQQEVDHATRCELLFQEYWHANRPTLKAQPPGEAEARFAALREKVRRKAAF